MLRLIIIIDQYIRLSLYMIGREENSCDKKQQCQYYIVNM